VGQSAYTVSIPHRASGSLCYRSGGWVWANLLILYKYHSERLGSLCYTSGGWAWANQLILYKYPTERLVPCATDQVVGRGPIS